MSKFSADDDLHMYDDARPALYFNRGNLKEGVLLLHGFSSSTEEFEYLLKEFQEKGISYYAPMLTGFGLTSFDLMYKVNAEDWLRDAVNAYDVLAGVVEKVNIIGHSTGSVLAAYVAQVREVKNIIQIGPNFFSTKADELSKKLICNNFIFTIVQWLFPITKKPVRPGRVTCCDTLDPVSAQNGVHYQAISIKSVREMWELTEKVCLEKMRFEKLTLIYGENDITVNIKQLIDTLKAKEIRFNIFEIPNSAHNVLKDYGSKEAIKIICNLLDRE